MQPVRNKLRPRLPAIMLERRGTLIYFNQVLDRTRDLFCTWSISQFVTCSMGTRYKRFLLTYFSVIFLKLSSCLSSEEEEQIKIEWIMSVILLLIIVWLGAVTTTSNPMDAKPKACIGHCVANEFTKVHLGYLWYPYNWDKLTDHLSTSSTHQFMQNFPSHSQWWVKLHQLTSQQTARNGTHPKPSTQPSRTSTADFWLLKYLSLNPPFCTLKHAGHRKHPQRGKRIGPTGFNGKECSITCR